MGKLSEFFKGLKKNNNSAAYAPQQATAPTKKSEPKYNLSTVFFVSQNWYDENNNISSIEVTPVVINEKRWTVTDLRTGKTAFLPKETSYSGDEPLTSEHNMEDVKYILGKLYNKHGASPVKARVLHSSEAIFNYNMKILNKDPFRLYAYPKHENYDPNFLNYSAKKQLAIVEKNTHRVMPANAIKNLGGNFRNALYELEIRKIKIELEDNQAALKDLEKQLETKPKQNKQADQLISEILAMPSVKSQQKPTQTKKSYTPRSNNDILKEIMGANPKKIVSDIKNGKQPQHNTQNTSQQVAK